MWLITAEMGDTMTEHTENPDKDEVTDEQLEAIAGGAAETTKEKVVKKETTDTGSGDGEAGDAHHKEWIDIL